jgi:D-aminopeptidase
VSFGIVFHSIWQWTLQKAKQKGASLPDISHNYGTPVVGETADWILNDVYDSALEEGSVMQAFNNAETQEEVLEGQNGGGAGMTCHMFPAGTGTSSRIVKGGNGETYTIGVIVQSNYGHTRDLQVGGVPIGKLLVKERTSEEEAAIWNIPEGTSGKADDGSIVIYLMSVHSGSSSTGKQSIDISSTDAPLLPHQLNRVARHCAIGLAQVGGHGVGRNHSGDIILALSTANKPNEINDTTQVDGVSPVELNQIEIIKNESTDTLFRAASEATEEAILNSIVAGRAGRTGNQGYKLAGFPVERVKELLKKHLVVV